MILEHGTPSNIDKNVGTRFFEADVAQYIRGAMIDLKNLIEKRTTYDQLIMEREELSRQQKHRLL